MGDRWEADDAGITHRAVFLIQYDPIKRSIRRDKSWSRRRLGTGNTAATTVYGLTARRLWASTTALLALVSVVIGGWALARPANRVGTGSRRLRAFFRFPAHKLHNADVALADLYPAEAARLVDEVLSATTSTELC